MSSFDFTLVAETNPVYTTLLIAACDGFLDFVIPALGYFYPAGNQGSAPLVPILPVSMCYLNNAIYAVDGTNIAYLPLATQDVTPYAVSAAISSITFSGPLAVVTTSSANGFTSGQTIFISGATIPVSSITSSGTLATVTTTINHDLQSGDIVNITGATQTPYNGNFAITVLTPTTFTYNLLTTTSSPATGTPVINDSNYNGEFEITVVSPTVFTYTPTVPPTENAAGTPVVTNIIGIVPTNIHFCCNWRGRLVFAGDSMNPQNFYMARVGVPTDWNFAATDPAAAVAGNLSESGQIGEPITCLIPFTDDYMMIGCTNSIWMLEGDPADGGTIVRVSDKMGILGPNAWTTDAAGTVYFLGNGGLYSVRPLWEFYQPPTNLSEKVYDQFFQGIDWSNSQIALEWDTDQHYLNIYITPSNGTSQGTHLIYDARNNGFWPQQYPVAAGPYSALSFVGNGSAAGRVTVLGGIDGYLRSTSLSALDDDGTAISSSVTMGPFKLDPEAAIVTGITIDLGEIPPALAGNPPFSVVNEVPTPPPDGSNTIFHLVNTPIASTMVLVLDGTVTLVQGVDYTISGSEIVFTALTTPDPGDTLAATYTALGNPPSPQNAVATLNSGPDAYSVTEGTPHSIAAVQMVLDRRQKTFRQRLRGGWFSIMLSNNQDSAFFSFESATVESIPAGRNRERR